MALLFAVQVGHAFTDAVPAAAAAAVVAAWEEMAAWLAENSTAAAVEDRRLNSVTPRVIYGDDHRRDWHALDSTDAEDALALTLLQNVIVSHVEVSDLGSPDTGGVYRVLDSYPDDDRLGPYWNMCDGQRFVRHPTLSSCSGTLVGADQVITAGHCMNSQEKCDNAAYVFKYYVTGYDSDGDPIFPEITTDDVYFCSEFRTQHGFGGVDIALVKLNRAVVGGRTPATYHKTLVPTTVGQKLLMIGFPSGMPAKVDDGGTVTNTNGNGYEFFEGSTDSFGGNSGSGIFDENGTMIGVLVRGRTDYVCSGGGDWSDCSGDDECVRVNELEDHHGTEDITYVDRVTDLFFSPSPPPLPPGAPLPDSCGAAVDLSTETSPLSSSTADALSTYKTSCGSTYNDAPERIFFIGLLAGEQLKIGMRRASRNPVLLSPPPHTLPRVARALPRLCTCTVHVHCLIHFASVIVSTVPPHTTRGTRHAGEEPARATTSSRAPTTPTPGSTRGQTTRCLSRDAGCEPSPGPS